MAETNTELALEISTETLPDAVAFSPELAGAATVESIGTVPAGVQEKVTIGPVAGWIVERAWEKDAGSKSVNAWLLMDRQYHAERHEHYSRNVKKLDTIGAVRGASQWRVDFDPRNECLTIHSLAVVRGDKRIENARTDRLRILQREVGLDCLEVHGLLTVVVLMEDVRQGDVLDVSYTIQGRSFIFPDHFWCWITVPEQMRVEALQWSVRFATGREMRWKSNDPELTPTVREEQGETEWTWRSSASPVESVEKNVPARFCVGKWIQISSFTSWTEVSSGIAATWKEDLDCPEIVNLAETFAAAGNTPAQRVELALNFLQDEVRYLSVTGDFGGFVPTSPGLVLRRRFGDCKDKSFAAAHLLRRLGTPARPVLVNSVLREAVQDFLPMPGVFDHVIVEYEIEGQRRWVDVTWTLQGGTALTRPGAPFRLGLPVGPGVQELEPIVTDTAARRLELRETFFIDTSGRTSSLRISITAGGREAEVYRRSMAEIGAEDFARSRERFLQRIFPHAKRAGKLKWEDDRENNEFVLGEVFDLNENEAFNYDRRAAQFRMTAHTIQAVLGYYHVGERERPWALRFPCRIKHIIEIDSPSLGKPRPRSEHVDGKAFRFSSSWQGHQGLASITYTLQVLKDCVPAEEFEAFKLDVQEVLRKIGILGRLPPGSAVSWRKRSPENVLPRRRSRLPNEAREQRDEAIQSAELPALAPACASPEVMTPRSSPSERIFSSAGGTRSPVAPRKESAGPVLRPLPKNDRKEIRRPNPAVATDEQPPEVRTERRRARRAARQKKRIILWTAGAVVLAGLVVILVIAAHLK